MYFNTVSGISANILASRHPLAMLVKVATYGPACTVQYFSGKSLVER